MRLLFGLFPTLAAYARGGFPRRRAPPESRSHLGERGRSGAVLEAFEPAIEVGGRQVKASGQARGLEARRDLFHLADPARSEEHTSELQSRPHLVCRLLLEKKKKQNH